MINRERNAFTPSDLCGLVAHEITALLYGVGANGIPSAEALARVRSDLHS